MLFLIWANAAPAHGKAHSVLMDSRKSALCWLGGLQTALFRHVATREAWDATPRQPAGHYGKWPNWANALEQPPARLRGGLRRGSQAPAWGLAARKDAVWAEGLAKGAP